MLLSSISKLYGGWNPTGVEMNLTDMPDYNPADYVKAEVCSRDFTDEATGELRTRTSINLFTKSGQWRPLPLSSTSLLKLGDLVDLKSLRVIELAKGTEKCYKYDGVKAV